VKLIVLPNCICALESSGKYCRPQQSVVLRRGAVLFYRLSFWRSLSLVVGLPLTLEKVDQSCMILKCSEKNPKKKKEKKEEAEMAVGLI